MAFLDRYHKLFARKLTIKGPEATPLLVQNTAGTTLASLDSSGNLTVAGTQTFTGGTNFDGAVDFDGNAQFDGTVTVGVDDTGKDVQFFGATTGKNWLWDESADTMIVTGASTLAGNTGITGTATVTSASASSLAVGLAGATNPAFQVDSSTGSQAAGLKVTGAIAAGTVAVAVVSSGADANLTINAKGTGTIGIGSVSTGAVTITPATTVTGALTCTAGVQSSAVAVTATADGLTTGIIPAGASFVSITSAAATNMVTLPSAVVGNIIWLYVGANGCELITPAGSNATINTVDSDGTNQVDIPATTLLLAVCVAADTWILQATDELGAVITALIPDND